MSSGDAKIEALLAEVLAMPDVAPIARERRVAFVADQVAAFVVAPSGEIRLGRAAFESVARLRLAVRHALEVGIARELRPDDDALAERMAARSAALFATLEREAHARAYETRASIPPPFSDAPSETARRLTDVWPLLGPAEYLMGTGGDVRISLDAETGLNAYGCSPRPRPWAVTFASSTASSISERGYAGAESARRRILRAALEHGADASLKGEMNAIRRALVAFYALPAATEVVLAPSGTDGELAALAVSLLGDSSRPLASVLVAPEESGTGVPLAATGHHFATLTARGVPVTKGARIEGFPETTPLVTIAARAEDGSPRDAADVDAECRAKIAAALAQGRRVLLHVMDQTKTGLITPADAASIAGSFGGIDVVVDACQARVSVASIQAYLARGFMVLVSGSKFFTGPPFAGALLLPPQLASRLAQPRALPTGLADYFGRFEWPDAPACALFTGRPNVGLALRWDAALAEMDAFATTPETRINEVLSLFGARVRAAVAANPDLVLHAVPVFARSGSSSDWDRLPTIFTFSIRAPTAPGEAARCLDVDEARQVYGWLNSDLSACLPSSCGESEKALAARLFHIGQPVALATPSQRVTGALRISAGARLVSGEPSQAELDPSARLEREIDDALGALAKISLIVRHLGAVRAASPRPMFQR